MDTQAAGTRPIGFDSFVLAAALAELQQNVPARVQKIQQPSDLELLLTLYGRGGAQRLLISADPRLFRLHITTRRRENPIAPPAFCQVCRKYLDGAVLTAVLQPEFDRIAELDFRAHDGERVRLIAELMGRNANVILISSADTVRGALRSTPPDSIRPMRPGATYTPPPARAGQRDPRTVTAADTGLFADAPSEAAARAEWLSKNFVGVGKFAAQEMAERAAANGPDALQPTLISLMTDVQDGNFSPHSIGEGTGTTVGVWAFKPVSVPAGLVAPRSAMSVALDTFYATLAERGAESSARQSLAAAVEREIAFREKDVHSLRETLAEAEKAYRFEELGNNLLAHLAEFKRGDRIAVVPDLYSAAPAATVEIPLDAKRTPHENAEALFNRASRARDAGEYADGRLVDRLEELEALTELRDRIAASEDEATRARLRTELAEIVGAERAGGTRAAPAKPRAGERPYGGHKIRRFTVEDYELLIGESAEANDYLTTRVASPSDLWMHVRSAPGAHAILRTAGKPERVGDDIIRRAAAIVAARSGTAIKHAGLVAVDVVEKRHVRKPRGAKAGAVLYTRERVFDVQPGM